jgi:hypothetical protein
MKMMISPEAAAESGALTTAGAAVVRLAAVLGRTAWAQLVGGDELSRFTTSPHPRRPDGVQLLRVRLLIAGVPQSPGVVRSARHPSLGDADAKNHHRLRSELAERNPQQQHRVQMSPSASR